MRYISLFLLFKIIFLFSKPTFSQVDYELICQEILKKTNEFRIGNGLKKLKQLDSLMEIAQAHSENMVNYKFYSHIDHNGLDPVKRAENRGIKAWTRKGNMLLGISENIAKIPWFVNVTGCGDTRSIEAFSDCMVRGWINSPPHRKNILGDYTFIGVGLFFDKKGIGYGTQNFR